MEKKIQKLDKYTLRELRARMQGVLNKVGEEWGIDIKVASATYTATHATFKVEVASVVDGEVQSKEVAAFKMFASSYGFKPEDLNREFTDAKNRRCIIIGLRTRSYRYPIVCRIIKTGAVMKATARYVKQCFG